MSNQHIHIVSLDIPYPADYGGVIDIYYQVKALADAGLKIHLHCFYRDRKPANQQLAFCEQVYYYKRGIRLHPAIPYIVYSRRDNKLLERLSADNWPIILHGVHCSYFLYKGKFSQDRKILLRLHNTETLYYRTLALHEKNAAKKLFFKAESILLNKYEQLLANKATLLAISRTDYDNFKNLFGAKNIYLVPAYIPNNTTNIIEGSGEYCFYHGNLSVNENEIATIWLLQHVFSNLQIPFIIAGKYPSKKLKAIVAQNKYARLIENPAEEKMLGLIREAQINIVPSFNNTGLKLKLLNVLFNGRHCIANTAAVAGIENLHEVCSVANTADEFRVEIKRLMQIPFTSANIVYRENLLHNQFSNKTSTATIISLLQ